MYELMLIELTQSSFREVKDFHLYVIASLSIFKKFLQNIRRHHDGFNDTNYINYNFISTLKLVNSYKTFRMSNNYQVYLTTLSLHIKRLSRDIPVQKINERKCNLFNY